MIITPAQFRAFLTEDVPHSDDVLKVLLDANEAALVRWAGPLGTVTEVVRAPYATILSVRQPIQAVLTVTDISGTTETDIVADDYLIDGNSLRRLGGFYWGERTVVEYASGASAAEYIVTLVELVQCDLNHQPGMSSQSAGPWQESYSRDHTEERQRILESRFPGALFA